MLTDLFTKNIIVIGGEIASREIADYLQKNPRRGYRLIQYIPQFTRDELNQLSATIVIKNVAAIIVPSGLPQTSSATEKIHDELLLGVPLIDAHTMYEKLFGKLALAEIEEGHFLTLLTKRSVKTSSLRLFAETLIAFMFFIILLPLMALIALVIILTSRGGPIIRQTRTGEFGRVFTLYKFRSMRHDAERNGPQWSTKDDQRITPLGKILRRTHLDELPQLWNIIKGDLAFVGPRPERPELIALIRKKVPHFELRNVVRPGVSGWGQVKFGYGATVEDAREKLRYDLYYIKHKSLLFDISIVLRTLSKIIT